jgi:hypothetical protein
LGGPIVTDAVWRACLPWLGWLLFGFAGAWLTARVSGARFRSSDWNWRVWSRLHRSEGGAVQSLSLVLTLPLFMMFVLFIVQVSQVMIGTMVVHYAAYAAARAAIVWIPAAVSDLEPENVVATTLTQTTPGQTWGTGPLDRNSPALMGAGGSPKLQNIYAAAVLAVSPICPSRDLYTGSQVQQLLGSNPVTSQALPVLLQWYPGLANSNRRGAIERRMENKLAYSLGQTAIVVEWREVPNSSRDADVGPSYNPRNHKDGYRITQQGIVITSRAHVFNPNEVGWEDTVTVWVRHNYALLPGPGRFLSKFIQRQDGQDDATARRIRTGDKMLNERLYTTELVASATLTNEGLKSVRPAYVTP